MKKTNKMRVLNLYSGIGGNRKLWSNEHEITSIELNPKIAEIYQEFFPNDEVIVADAHKYLLENYKDYDFIWSSPPCPTHSDIRRCGVHRGQYEALYPDMTLYQEIILLQNFSKGLWVIENVKPYYKPLIEPSTIQHRHLFWSNFLIYDFILKDDRRHKHIQGYDTIYGFNISDTKINDKRKVLRNCVFPELGKHILDCALKAKGFDIELSNSQEIFDFEEAR